MAVLHHSYLFRADSFRQAVQPLIPDLRSGHYEVLRQRALPLAAQPDVRSFLAALRADDGYDEGWTDVEPEVFFSMLLVEFATPFPLGQGFDQNGWTAFHVAESAARFAGWARQDVERICNGRVLCELLGEAPIAVDEDHRRWCASTAGWLSTEDIERYRSEMDILQQRCDQIADLWRAKWPVWTGNGELPRMINDSLSRYCATYDAALSSQQQLLVFTMA
mgnify:CR=1 FL=1